MKIACPKCGSKDTLPIVFGKPTPAAFRAYERGELEIGGCEPFEHNRVCKACDHLWTADGNPFEGIVLDDAEEDLA